MLGHYNILMRVARRFILTASAFASEGKSAKFLRFSRGQRGALSQVVEGVTDLDRSRPTIWIHAASLGEFGIARPIIESLKKKCACNIVLTFFSPTGYEAVSVRQGIVDKVFYLPLDTHANAEVFLDAVRPDCAVFIVSEFWHNYLDLLRKRDIPTFLLSAIIRDDSPFFKWWGGLYRDSLKTFKRIFTLDEHSVTNLHKLGVDNVTVNGDPLFDNVVCVAGTEWSDPVIEKFLAGRKAFLAGSIHRDKDLDITTSLCNRYPAIPFIFVPHEITPDILDDLKKKIDGKVLLYSECTPDTDFKDVKALVIDFVGALAYIYRYAGWSYVGGGFTDRLLHSVIEPAVYGVPVAFGPNIHRKVTPREMEKLGVGKIVRNEAELAAWFESLRTDAARLAYLSKAAAKYVRRNTGSTDRVTDIIIKELWEKN